MHVVKRNGQIEHVMFDKITTRVKRLCDLNPPLPSEVDPVLVSQKVILGVYSGVKTTELDILAAETAAYMSTQHPGYETLAARIAISNMHKQTEDDYFKVVEKQYNFVDKFSGELCHLVSTELYDIVSNNRNVINNAINYDRDYKYGYFGFKTLERSYLMRLNGVIVERPQQMLMRVSIGIHGNDIDKVLNTYDCLSKGYFIHATPTLFNAGTTRGQMSSCFLMRIKDDSIEGIYETLKQTALISKSAGGIGFSVHNIRASRSFIRGTNGFSNGLVPMLRVFNDTARYVDQGGGKRKGSFAVYLEPWHADIMDWLDLKKNHGKEELRARDLFYALWIPDLFMKRVKNNQRWSLFCPAEAPGLCDKWGEEFEQLYEEYEQRGIARESISAQSLWFAIINSQIETGTPFMLYKDTCNQKSNQQNLGTITCSNLCTEIIQYTSADEVAVCNLASISLPNYVETTADGKKHFNLQLLYDMVYQVTENLNKIIDRNYYPVNEARESNLKHRPIGIGVQGLADVFLLMRYPFESADARKLNIDIFETIYYAALSCSNDLAAKSKPYDSFANSPASKGILQFDMWNVKPSLWDWEGLKRRIVTSGLKNSLLIAPMPTASTSQILGNNECFEPYTSNIYTRRVIAGEFTIINKHLIKDLIELNLWTPELKNTIIANNGSVQGIPSIPSELQELYKTVWEIKQKTLINMAIDRGPFIDQSQSLNIFIPNPSVSMLTSLHFYTWEKGLKTGMYYLRTRPATNAIQFTIDQSILNNVGNTVPSSVSIKPPAICSTNLENQTCSSSEDCLACGS